MKKLILVTACALCTVPGLEAQSFSLVSNEAGSLPDGQSKNQKIKKACTVTIIGIPVASVGLCLLAVGAVDELGAGQGPATGPNGNPALGQSGQAFLFAGGVTLIAGVGMLIGGGIHDMVGAVRRRRMSVVVPRGNEVGLAYHFR
jgi:hypothetical protein